MNCLLNQTEQGLPNVNFVQMDWSKPESDYTVFFNYDSENGIQQHDKDAIQNEKFDVIFGADILYETKHFKLLIDLMD